MATKVNKQFVLLLVVVCVGVSMLVGGLALWAYRQNATRNVTAGDEYMAQGDYELAADQYGRAVSKEPSSLAYLDKYEEALLKIKPETMTEANERFGQWLAVLNQRSSLRPENPEFALALMEELRRAAVLSNASGLWTQLRDHGERVLTRIREGDPGHEQIQYLKLLAESELTGTLGAGELLDFRSRFKTFIEANPEHVQSRVAFGKWLVFQSIRSAGAGSADAEREYDQAKRYIEEAKALAPDDFQVVLAEYILKRSTIARKRGESNENELRATLDQLFEAARQQLDLETMLIATNVLRTALGETGIERGIQLAEAYIESSPDSLMGKRVLAQLNFDLNQFTPARTLATEILESDPVPVSFLAQFRFQLLGEMAKLVFDIEYAEAESAAAGTEARRVARQELQNAYDRLEGLVGTPDTNPLTVEARAWMAFLDGQFEQAASLFSQVIDGYVGTVPPIRVLWTAASALERQGAPGEARRLLLMALQQAPSNPILLRSLSQLEYRMGLYIESADHAIDTIIVDPDNESARLVLAQVYQLLPEESRSTIDQRLVRVRNESQIEVSLDAEVMAGQSVIDIAEKYLEEDNAEAARSVLLEAVEANPENPALRFALVNVEIQGGWRDEAIVRLDRLASDFPQQDRFRILLEQLRGADDVEVVKRWAASQYADENARTIAVWTNLSQMARAAEQAAQRMRDEGNASEADDMAGRAARYRDEASNVLASIPESVRTTSEQFINERFNQLIEDEAYDEAQRWALIARDANADQANGLTYRARLHMAQGDLASAVVALDDASRVKPYSAWVWRTLGYVYEQLGNTKSATDAYRNALQRQPSDVLTIQLLAQLLSRTGERSQALELLRRVAINPNATDAIVEQWLQLEAEVGSPHRAIERRRNRFQEDPDDRTNAVRLASLLGTTIPRRETIVNDTTGQVRYTDREWIAMRESERQEIIQAAKQKWLEEAERIFALFEADTTDDLALRLSRARYLRDIGKVADAYRLMQEYVSAFGPEREDATIYLAYAQFLREMNDMDGALQALTQGLKYQSETAREVDRALGNLYILQQEYEKALEHLARVNEATNDPQVQLQMIEAMYNLQQYDEASSDLAAYEEAHGATFQVELLHARVKMDQAGLFYRDDQDGEGRQAEKEARVHIETARKLAPDQPWPHVLAAMMKFNEFKRTDRRNPALLTDADLELTKALNLQANFMPALQLRSEVALAKSPPDYQSAIRQYERLLSSDPRNDEVRRAVVELAERSGNRQKALNVAAEGIRANPLSPQWHVATAELLARAGQFANASEAYRAAFERSGQPGHLQRWAEMKLNESPPKAQQVLDVFAQQRQLVDNSLGLRPVMARALAALGRWDEAVEAISRAYEEHRAAAEERDAEQLIAIWFGQMQQMYAGRSVAEMDELIRTLSAGEMTQNERYYLATAWMRSGEEGGLDRAIALLNEALEHTTEEDRGDRAALYLELGRSHWVASRFDEAVAHFRKSLEYGPDVAATHNDLAYTLVAGLNRPQDALVHAERAAELAPQNASIIDTLGAVYLKLDRLEDAERYLRRSVELAPLAENHLHLAEVFERKGETARARQYLERALQLNPDSNTRAEIQRLLDDMTS